MYLLICASLLVELTNNAALLLLIVFLRPHQHTYVPTLPQLMYRK